MSQFGTNVGTLDLSKIPDVQLPEPAPDGRLLTLSNFGYATQGLLGPSEAFVEFASKCKDPVLDIGASFGETTVAAL